MDVLLKKTEEIREAVKEALRAKDAEYQLVEVVRTFVEEAHTECAKIASRHAIEGHSVQAPTCYSIANEILRKAGLYVETRDSNEKPVQKCDECGKPCDCIERPSQHLNHLCRSKDHDPGWYE